MSREWTVNERLKALERRMSAVSTGIGVDHARLTHLAWSVAAHTFDCDLDIGAYDFIGANVILTGKVYTLAGQGLELNYGAASRLLNYVTATGRYTFSTGADVQMDDAVFNDDTLSPSVLTRIRREGLAESLDETTTRTSGLLSSIAYTTGGLDYAKLEVTYT